MGVERVSAHADLGFRMTRMSSYVSCVTVHLNDIVTCIQAIKIYFFHGKNQYEKVANQAEFYQGDGHV